MDRSSRVRSGCLLRISILPPACIRGVRSVVSTTRTSGSPRTAATTRSAWSMPPVWTVMSRTVWPDSSARSSTAPMVPPASPIAVATRPSIPGRCSISARILIEGNSLVYRAFFALPESIATSDGRPTNAIFGFASMLVKIITDYGIKPTVVVWDAGSSGRKEVYSDYKAQRAERPSLLGEQWPAFEPLVEAFGYENLHVAGYEADDVIATLTDRAVRLGIDVMVVTGDRDAYQLIDDGHVKIMTTSRGITDTRVYDREGVIERYGIPPELIPDFIGLKGDTSDNIPGVPGIGDKTAADLLQRFGDLEGVLSHVDDISGAKRKQNLVEHADAARMSKQLATMVTDVPIDIDPAAEVARELDRSRLREVFREFELREPLRRLEEALDVAAAEPVPRERGPTALRARVHVAPVAQVAKLPGDPLAIAMRPPEAPEGALFVEGTPWRYGAYGGGD